MIILRLFFAILLLTLPLSAQAQEDSNALDMLFDAPAPESEDYIPSYTDDIAAFNAISDEDLLNEIIPERLNPPPEDNLNPDDMLDAPALFNPPQEQDNGIPREFSVTEDELTLYTQLPQELLDDAQDFFESCQRDHNMATHYECRCMAKAYLDKAIETGPGYTRSRIIDDLQNHCPNMEQMAGTAYQQCFTQGFYIPTNTTMENYCSCFGNEYARYMARSQMRMGSRKITAARSHALERCKG